MPDNDSTPLSDWLHDIEHIPDCGCRPEGRGWPWNVEAERILADPGPLLEALAEAGVLQRDEDALIHYRYGVNSGTLRARNKRGSIASAIRQHEQRTHGPIGVERIETRTTFAHTTEWRPTDA